MPSYPLINGLRYDWSSVTISVNGQQIVGVTSLSYSQTLDPGIVRGTSAQVLGRTRGEYDAEGSLEMHKEEAQALLNALGDGFMEKSFDITVSYSEAAAPVITDNLKGCRITSDGDDHASGTDPIMVSFDLHILAILKGGKKPLTKMLGV